MTLQDYIKTLPKERVSLAADDINEAAKIEQEHAALPNAVLDDAEVADGAAEQPQAPEFSFDITSDDDTAKFIKGMELSHPELVMRLKRDERAWDQMLEVDRANTARMNRDGGLKFTGDDKSDYEFFRWASGRGYMDSDTSVGAMASAFGRGLWTLAKGAVKTTAMTANAAANPQGAGEAAATLVDSAQAAVSEYQQLGAGLAVLTAGDDPQVKMAARYELAKFADQEQKNHNAWRKSISEAFAAIPVDQDNVEFLSEAFDVSNLIGAGAGKLVTGGMKRVGAGAAAEVLGASRAMWGSEMAAKAMSKVPVVGAPYKRAILMGQADSLFAEVGAAYEEVAKAQAELAAKRATLAANPASSPKDVLLREIAAGEADVAKKQAAYNQVKTQLDTTRQGITEALNVEGRSLTNRAVAGTLTTAGDAIAGTGRLMTNAYRGASEMLTGSADDAAFDMAAGQVVGNVANKGNFITRIGNDISIAGRTMAENGASIPYFRRLRQAEDASKLTRGASAFIDWSHLGWAADKGGDLLKAGAAGAPISGAFGYVASGGDLVAAAESAGAGAAYGLGGGAYGQWQAYKDPNFRWQELLANRTQFRDTLSRREVNGQSQLRIFDQLGAGEQIALATYAQGKPDVAFRFINDPKAASGFYDNDNNVVVINQASKTPVGDIFRHEVAHFVERHGLQSQVRQMYLGDAEKGVIGQYTAIDKMGNPVLVEQTGPDGEKTYEYKLNEAGEKLKAEYESKIRAVDPTFSMSPEYFASEIFAEQYADRLLGGNFRRDLSRNAVDNIVDALASKPILKNFLGNIGLLFDQNENIVGTGVFTDLKRNREVEKLISRWESEAAKGRKTGIQDEVEQHVFTEAELRDPAVATKWLQGGGAMRFGPDGKPVFDSKGQPQFLTEREADALQRDLANELITQIERHAADNPGEADLIQRREIVDLNGNKRTVFSGKRIPAAVIDALEAQGRFNPHQLAHLRAASASVEKNGVGAMIAHFYQAASRKLGGKAYKTVGGRWRRDGVVGFQITKDGNVVLNSVSWEQLAENARKAGRTKLARETYSTAGVPVDSAIMADVKTYLGNLVDGKPGATGIGEQRRDFINNLLGIRMAANADANPLFETTDAPKTILTSLRLDRINRMAPLDYVDVAWGPQQYRQAKANLRPETMVARDMGSNVDFAAPPSDEVLRAAMQKAHGTNPGSKAEKIGAARSLEAGTPVDIRIDIPTFNATKKDGEPVFAVTIHSRGIGKVLGYDSVATVDNPTFMSRENAAKAIRDGANKTPIAVVRGEFNPAREVPKDINEWTPVGFDPLDHSYFYDKRTDEPVVGGSQAISVGNTVFVKDPVYGDRSQFQYRPDSRQTETPEFKKWFGKSKVVDAEGKPLAVYHGTTHDFTVFDAKRSNIENDWGKAFYFSNTPDDITTNYAGEGPDLTNRINRLAERIRDENGGFTIDAKLQAKQALKGSNDGAVMPVYLKMENPLVLGGRRETEIDMESLIVELQIAAQKFDGVKLDAIEDDIKTHLAGNVDGYESDDVEPSAQQIIEAADYSVAMAMDESGDLASKEIIREAVQAMGFDGIIDRTVNKKFGSQSRRMFTSQMKGMDPSTVHYIVFDPTQIKSATGNTGAFDPKNPDIRYRPETGPARNEDAYARSKEQIEEAIPPEQRYVGGYEPGKPIKRPSGRKWHSGDLTAPVGNLGFTQKTIDSAFQRALDESGPAARRAVDALAAAGSVMTPPSEKHWSDAGKNLKMVDRLWYEVSSESMSNSFPSDNPKDRLVLVADQIAATSPLADPNYNAELAISILSEMERGSPIYTPAVNMTGVSDAALGRFGAGESRKVGSFSGTFKFLGGAVNEPPLTTNDRQVAASFNIPDAAFGQYPVLYEVVARFYNHLRDNYNDRNGMVGGKWKGDDNGPMQSHQLQAISWVQTRAESRMQIRKEISEEDAFNGDAYNSAFRLAAQRLRDGGVSVPVDDNGDPQFTREVLMNPKVSQILAPTSEDFKQSLMLTQEIGTNLTETGKEFNDLIAKSKELGIVKNLEDADKITNRYLNALGQRTKVAGKAKKDPSIMGKLVSAFVGKPTDVSRIEKGWGSFIGDFSKNLRVPIDDVPEQYREAFISVIGRQLKQAAGAASKFINTDPTAPSANATRTYSVFLPGVLDPSSDLTVLAKELSTVGHEVNVSQRPNGLVIDVNPAFGDSGPKGIDFEALDSAVRRTFGTKAKISSADHSSYYVDNTQYGAKIAEARRNLLNEAARNIAQYFPSVGSAKDFIRGNASAEGGGVAPNDRRRVEAVRARYTESIRLLESAEQDLARVAKDFEQDMKQALDPLRKRIDKATKTATPAE